MPDLIAPPTVFRLATDVTVQVEPTSADALRQPDLEQTRKLTEFMSRARRRMRACIDGTATWRAKADEDRRFRSGEGQWDQDTQTDRQLHKRPCLTIPRLNGFHRQISNQQRSTRPSVRVHPVDDGADPKTAEVLQDYIRHIENISDADLVYLVGADSQIDVGVGYWRILTEWVDERSFDQEIKLAEILNYASVYMDPSATRQDGADANYVFVAQDLSREEYRETYSRSSLASLDDLAGVGDLFHADWMIGGKIRVADYYYIEPGPTVALAEILDPDDPLLGDTIVVPLDQVPPGATVLRQRTARSRLVKWAKINGEEILDGEERPPDALDGWRPTAGQLWPGDYLPVIRTVGEVLVVDGQIDYRGIFRDAKDAARMGNYLKSAAIEAIALVPQGSWVGAEGQFEGHPEWDLPPNVNISKREYKPVSHEGLLVPAPHREVLTPAIEALVLADTRFENDLRAIVGWVDVQPQEARREQSGVAIRARQAQGETQTGHFLDNWTRSIRHTGRVLINLIPRVIQRRQIIRLRGADDQQRTVMVHAGHPLPKMLPPELTARLQARGIKSLDDVYDLSVGRYDVTTSVSPRYESRRQEEVDALLELGRAFPGAVPFIADLIAKHSDWPGHDEIAKRLHVLVPAEARGDEDGEPPIPPPVLQKIQQQVALIDELTTRLAALEEEKRTNALEIASRERIEMRKIMADLIKTDAQIDLTRGKAVLEQSYDRLAALESQIGSVADRMLAEAAASTSLPAGPPAPPQPPMAAPPGAPVPVS